MEFWIRYIRSLVYALSTLLGAAVYISIVVAIPATDQESAKLIQAYAFLAIAYLYIALLASPLYSAFPNFPWRPIYIKARRAIGVSAFFFGLLHGGLAFFISLGGFRGLGFLNAEGLTAVTLGAVALLILSLLAFTSFDYFVKKLGTRWKQLHRLVYLAGLLIIIHALIFGTHFSDLSDFIPQVSFFLLLVLLALEAVRLNKIYRTKFAKSQ